MDFVQIKGYARAKCVAPSLRQIAVVPENNPSPIGNKVGAHPGTGPAEGAEILFYDFGLDLFTCYQFHSLRTSLCIAFR
jgi:hypothetical protein